jgi:hypothetical protein
MSAAIPVLLSSGQLAKAVGIRKDSIRAFVKLKLLQPAFVLGTRVLFRADDLGSVQKAIDLYRIAAPKGPSLFSVIAMCQRGSLCFATVCRAIKAGEIIPDFVQKGARPSFFFTEDRLGDIRAALKARHDRRGRPSKRDTQNLNLNI